MGVQYPRTALHLGARDDRRPFVLPNFLDRSDALDGCARADRPRPDRESARILARGMDLGGRHPSDRTVGVPAAGLRPHRGDELGRRASIARSVGRCRSLARAGDGAEALSAPTPTDILRLLPGTSSVHRRCHRCPGSGATSFRSVSPGLDPQRARVSRRKGRTYREHLGLAVADRFEVRARTYPCASAPSRSTL